MLRFLHRETEAIDTLIGTGTRLEGDLVFSGGLRVDGDVRGNVTAAGTRPGLLVVGATGRVEGDVRAARIVVSGVVSGSVEATELLEVLPGARISGTLRYGAIEVHPGGVLEVALRHKAPAAAPAQSGRPVDQSVDAPLPAASAA